MRFRRRKHDTEVELNITAFLNLMVVLIPFLLLNAVFAQVAILQLHLPSDDPSSPQQEEEELALALEVWIYSDRYVIADRTRGKLNVVENQNDKHDQQELQQRLENIKERYPDQTTVAILCEPDTPYDLLIQTMDTVRLHHKTVNGVRIQTELFPDINLGAAPPDSRLQEQPVAGEDEA